jgi:hypothetical protein
MRFFIDQFLSWRQDAGMNNHIADDLTAMFLSVGLENIKMEDASELNSIEEVDFIEVAGIWIKVAETRGQQMVVDGYVTDRQRLEAIKDYTDWLENEGQSMTLYLRAVSGTTE